MFVGLDAVWVYGFAADPAHLGGSKEIHRGGLFYSAKTVCPLAQKVSCLEK
jgi:hypothetical protein